MRWIPSHRPVKNADKPDEELTFRERKQRQADRNARRHDRMRKATQYKHARVTF
jgi:hypothetical protein